MLLVLQVAGAFTTTSLLVMEHFTVFPGTTYGQVTQKTFVHFLMPGVSLVGRDGGVDHIILKLQHNKDTE